MKPTRIENAAGVLEQPPNWNEAVHGPCAGLPVRVEEIDGIKFLVSSWEPTPAELIAIKRGAAIRLYVSAPVHPVVSLGVGPIPGEPQAIPELTFVDTTHPLANMVEIWDDKAGIPLDRWVRAVNTAEGWAECYCRDTAGKVRTVDGKPDGAPLMQRIEGQFSIRWKEEPV